MAGLTRESYFEAGLALLGEKGPEALTLAALCERVGVTKGSFYHHFGSMAELHRGMLEHWAAGRTVAASPDIDAGDASTRLTALRQMAVTANHETEVAIRSWATWYEPAADAHRQVERRRRRVLAHTF